MDCLPQLLRDDPQFWRLTTDQLGLGPAPPLFGPTADYLLLFIPGHLAYVEVAVEHLADR